MLFPCEDEVTNRIASGEMMDSLIRGLGQAGRRRRGRAKMVELARERANEQQSTGFETGRVRG